LISTRNTLYFGLHKKWKKWISGGFKICTVHYFRFFLTFFIFAQPRIYRISSWNFARWKNTSLPTTILFLQIFLIL
jgi:hypothetical protein